MATASSYLETRIMTAPPAQLHLIVVESALRFARLAEEALGQQDFEAAHIALGRSRELVDELVIGLNPEPNPELVDQLKGMFLFVHRNLTRADLTHDHEAVQVAIKILELHRETWLEVIARLPAETPPRPNMPTTSFLA